MTRDFLWSDPWAWIRLRPMIALLASLWLATTVSPSASAADLPHLAGRSIPDLCRFIYRIETDFKLTISASPLAREVTLHASLQDLLDDARPWVEQEPISLVKGEEPGIWSAGFTWVTMSQNPRLLAREVRFHWITRTQDGQWIRDPAQGEYHAPFGHWMNRCYPGGRDETPYQEATVLPPG